MVLTFLRLRQGADGLHPAAGPGPPDREHPVARFGLAGADQGGRRRRSTKSRRRHRGVAHMVSIAGMSFMLQANSPNFASMFIVLKPFDERLDPGLRDTAIMDQLRKQWAAAGPRRHGPVFGAAPVPGLGVAGGYKFMVEDRGGLGVRDLQRPAPTPWSATCQGKRPPSPRPPRSSAPTRRSSSSTSTGRRPPRWAFRWTTSTRRWTCSSARSTSTASTPSAATGKSPCRPTASSATASRTSISSPCETTRTRWSRWAR